MGTTTHAKTPLLFRPECHLALLIALQCTWHSFVGPPGKVPHGNPTSRSHKQCHGGYRLSRHISGWGLAQLKNLAQGGKGAGVRARGTSFDEVRDSSEPLTIRACIAHPYVPFK